MLKKGWYRTEDGHQVKVVRDMPHGLVTVIGVGIVGYDGDGKRQAKESFPQSLDLIMESWHPLPINVEAFVDCVLHTVSDEQIQEIIRYAAESSEGECILCHEQEHTKECPVMLLQEHLAAYAE